MAHRNHSRPEAYDKASRLVTSTDGGIVTGYGYDLVGNRQFASRGPANDFSSCDSLNGPDRLKTVERFTMGSMQRTEYLHDADGAVVPRQTCDSIFTPPMVTPNSPETFSYSFRDLLWKYTYNGTNNDWRYRYSASGEREQKRKYPLDTNIHATGHDNPWVYYLLGGGNEQLAVWHGRESWEEICEGTPTNRVLMYPWEYNTYIGGLGTITRILPPGEAGGRKQFNITDHLGSVRATIDSFAVRAQIDYEPFGRALVAQTGLSEPRWELWEKISQDMTGRLPRSKSQSTRNQPSRFIDFEPPRPAPHIQNLSISPSPKLQR